MTTKSPGAFRLFFTAGACLLLLPLKLVQGWRVAPLLLLVSSWVADACLLFLICALSVKVGGASRLRRTTLGGVVFVGLELPALVAVTAHTYYLRDAVTRRYSLLDSSFALVKYVFSEIVPRAVLWEAVGILAALSIVAVVVARRVSLPPRRIALVVLMLSALGVAVHEVRSAFYPSVTWEVGTDVAEVISHPAVKGTLDSAELADAGTGRRAAWPDSIPYDKVIVFVMESVPLQVLEDRMKELPKDHFFSRAREHTHSFTNYFSTNMDSRTGMLAMLFSRVVPYEAYLESNVAHYDFLKTERSLVDDLASRGYRTATAASQIDEEIIVDELPSWNDKLFLSQQEYDHSGGFLCLNPYEFEQGCEDKMLLPRLYRELDSHKRLFLFQEALYGHDEQFEEQIRKNPVQYYGEYLQAIQDHLGATGELDRTLIIVTSDHGLRGNEDRERRWVYRLPLLLINPTFRREERPGLYNQSDFAALVAAEMADASLPAPRSTSVFVGPTNTSILGSVTSDDDLLVLKERPWCRYVLVDGHCPEDDAAIEKPRHAVSPAALVERFKQLRAAFRPASPSY